VATERPPTSGQRALDVVARGLLAIGRALVWASRPLQRRWRSDDPLDAYSLVHMASVAGDTLVGIALADSVFFSLKPDEARLHVALYLGLTMAPLAVAAPVLVPLLDRGGFRRAISFGASGGRMLVAVLAAPRFDTLLLFPLAFVLLALSKIHTITKNGLTLAYAPSEEGLVLANARMGRLAAVGAALAAIPGLIALKVGGAEATLALAAVLYGVTMLLNLRLPQPPPKHAAGEVSVLGRVPSLAVAAAGTAGLRGAAGFLLFLLAFALRRSGEPTYWFGVLAAGATAGTVIGDLLAPRLPERVREEVVVFGSLFAAGVAGLLAFNVFELPVLGLFAVVVGGSTEFGRLAFQALMQRSAPGGAHGRVFVRYEVAFQLAWVAGAFIPAVIPISFRLGILFLAAFYVLYGLWLVARPWLARRPR
jgi:Major Facilitator Superfamily